jgi:hypothetical protein
MTLDEYKAGCARDGLAPMNIDYLSIYMWGRTYEELTMFQATLTFDAYGFVFS